MEIRRVETWIIFEFLKLPDMKLFIFEYELDEQKGRNYFINLF
jgi:hypothetical protein